MKKLLIALAVTATCLAVGVTAASAAKIRTHVTIHFASDPYAGDTFFGKVRSPKPACRKGRKVVVKRQEPGPDVRIGADRSDRTGDWLLELNAFAPPGDYYARAKRKRLHNGDVCKPDRSDTIHVPA